jgi:uncharacterized integral membrane protein (TIGR00697 family)
MNNNYKNYPEKISALYVAIAVFFVCFLMISNIVAGRLVLIHGLVLTGAIFLFPITYLFGDVLTEVYGFKRSRLVIWLGMIANIFMSLYFMFVINLPSSQSFTSNEAYSTVLGLTPLVVFASMLAYFAGEFVNSSSLSILKKITKGKWLWTRTVGSTILGELVDTLIFISIAFSFLPTAIFWQMIILQYIVKVSIEIILTPLTYWIINKFKKVEQLDTFDYGEKYNPFSLKTK